MTDTAPRHVLTVRRYGREGMELIESYQLRRGRLYRLTA